MLGRQNVGVEGLKYVEFGVTRINRYIVECKLRNSKDSDIHWIWINRYIVECKYRIRRMTDEELAELIDT